jgi:hypothetical protein
MFDPDDVTPEALKQLKTKDFFKIIGGFNLSKYSSQLKQANPQLENQIRDRNLAF